MAIIVVVNGILEPSLAKDTVKKTCEALGEEFDLNSAEEAELLAEGEVNTYSINLMVYEGEY